MTWCNTTPLKFNQKTFVMTMGNSGVWGYLKMLYRILASIQNGQVVTSNSRRHSS